jgi:sulfite exporter TauE/SafE
MQSLSAGALLPESIGPYIALMGVGFALAILGHLSRSRWMVAVGVIMIFLATLLFPLALQIFSDEPPPPGPRVPMAALLA